jgi:hypothetical protein
MNPVRLMFVNYRKVVNGEANCPLRGSVPVAACAKCPWMVSLQVRGVERRTIVVCRPRLA